jgi:inosose dehydratase
MNEEHPGTSTPANAGHDVGREGRCAVEMARLAGAPISWGVCEVPGWGRQLEPDRVLGEMAALGLRSTELGPVGWLPTDPVQLAKVLDRHGLRLAGGFVPFVLHTPDFEPARADAERMAVLLAHAGATVLNAAVVADLAWSQPHPLDDAGWRRLTDHLARLEEIVDAHGLTLAVHPHAGTLIEQAPDVERLLEATSALICLDTGHLRIGGADPAAFTRDHADRIAHVHLKDVDDAVAQRLNAKELSLMEAVQHGLFKPLGEGDAEIAEVIRRLEANGYEGRLVLEQDTAITGQEPPVGSGPVLDVIRSIEFLATVAPTKEEVM